MRARTREAPNEAGSLEYARRLRWHSRRRASVEYLDEWRGARRAVRARARPGGCGKAKISPRARAHEFMRANTWMRAGVTSAPRRWRREPRGTVLVIGASHVMDARLHRYIAAAVAGYKCLLFVKRMHGIHTHACGGCAYSACAPAVFDSVLALPAARSRARGRAGGRLQPLASRPRSPTSSSLWPSFRPPNFIRGLCIYEEYRAALPRPAPTRAHSARWRARGWRPRHGAMRVQFTSGRARWRLRPRCS